MNNKLTPKPFRFAAAFNEGENAIITTEHGVPIAEVMPRPFQYEHAKLLASAPELLEACERAVNAFNIWKESGYKGEFAFSVQQMRSAIAKATE